MEFRDYYATLGVGKNASQEAIKRAYRKLARECHPDLNPGDKNAEARFKAINEAHEVLGDPETRRKYDELGANWRLYEAVPAGARPGAGPAGWSVNMGSPGRTGYRTMTPEEMEALFGTADPFSDFFHTFFGGASRRTGGRGGRRHRSSRGRDVEQLVDLTLEEAFAGTSRRLTIPRAGGSRTVEVKIPAGIRDGARVRAAGEGGEGSSGGASGDLFLTVRLLPHRTFERRRDDLHVRIPVPLTTAVLGGEVAVPTPSGSTLRLKVPGLTPAGRTFRLRGHGMPVVGRAGERGDLYAVVDVQLPTRLTADERRHYEALRTLEDAAP
jgi:curved DNA-binding protein